jgi:hypothetical protein
MPTEATRLVGDPEDLLTAQEVSAITRLRPQTLADHRYKKVGIPYIKLGTNPRAPVRYRRRDVDAYMTDPLAEANG